MTGPPNVLFINRPQHNLSSLFPTILVTGRQVYQTLKEEEDLANINNNNNNDNNPSSSRQGHVLLLPYPGQGHVNPMVQFARRLVARGLRATLLTTVFISNSMGFGSSIGSVHLATISDGYDHAGFQSSPGIDAYLSQLRATGTRTLDHLIRHYNNNNNTNTPHVDCLVYEPFLPWALDVAKDHGLFAAAFFTQPCAVDHIYYNIHNRLLSMPIETTPVCIPGLPPMDLKDMPSFVKAPEEYPAYFEMVLSQFSNTDKADYVLINTFYHLEKEVVDIMSKVCPVLTIGPTVPSKYLDKRLPDDDDYGVDLFEREAAVSLDWIASKPPRSVVYVAFGSMASFSLEQMEELAWGLKSTNLYFLWVIRASEQAKLPAKFIRDDMGDKGLVVSWSPQVEILSREAIGCFFSHCGWNSTIEALSLGVPIVGMPQWTDQPPNAKLVEDVWKVGVRVRVGDDGIVRREEVEGCVRRVMDHEAGQLRDKARKWKALAVEAVSQGGTSDVNIGEFVSKLMAFKSNSAVN